MRSKLLHRLDSEGLRRIEVAGAHLSALRSFADRAEIAQLLESDRQRDVEARLSRLDEAPEGGQTADLRAELHRAISADGAAVVSGLPVDEDALLLCGAVMVGVPTPRGNAGGVFIHDVAPKPPNSQSELSDTSRVFPLHTDSAALDRPHDYVMLACVRADPSGGESSVLHVDELVREMSGGPGDDALQALQEDAFPYPHVYPDGSQDVKRFPILEAVGRAPSIRWRDDALEHGIAYGFELEERHRTALAMLRRAIDASPAIRSHMLEPGEILVADNRHALHGRSAIGEASGRDRLLRRMKLFSP